MPLALLILHAVMPFSSFSRRSIGIATALGKIQVISLWLSLVTFHSLISLSRMKSGIWVAAFSSAVTYTIPMPGVSRLPVT